MGVVERQLEKPAWSFLSRFQYISFHPQLCKNTYPSHGSHEQHFSPFSMCGVCWRCHQEMATQQDNVKFLTTLECLGGCGCIRTSPVLFASDLSNLPQATFQELSDRIHADHRWIWAQLSHCDNQHGIVPNCGNFSIRFVSKETLPSLMNAIRMVLSSGCCFFWKPDHPLNSIGVWKAPRFGSFPGTSTLTSVDPRNFQYYQYSYFGLL